MENNQQIIEFSMQVTAHGYLAWDGCSRHMDVG